MTPQELNQYLMDYEEGEYPPKTSGQTQSSKDPFQFQADQLLKPGEIIGVVRNRRFAPTPPHSHNYIEMNYVWSGSCTQWVEGQTIQTSQGDICIMDTFAVHSIGYCGPNDIVVNILMRKEYFDSSFFTRLTRNGVLSAFLIGAVSQQKNRDHFLKIHTNKNHYVREIITKILCEYYQDQVGRKESIDSCMILLFIELLRCLFSTDRPDPSDDRNQLLLSVLKYIETHSKSCSLSQAAEVFGFHPVYLTTLLKEKTGRSFLEHVQNQRLLKAKVLLDTTNLPACAIAEETGYSNISFFYRKFRESEGCTPLEYRNRHRKEP